MPRSPARSSERSSDGEISSRRLRLRPLAHEDVESLYALFNLPQVRRYLFDDRETDQGAVAAMVEASRACFAGRGFGLFSVFLSGADELVGFCGYLSAKREPELIYALQPALWGQDLTTEAAAAVIDWGFRERGFEQICAGADVPNAASIRVMQKLGMRYDETRVENEVECVYYSVTYEQFCARQDQVAR